MGEYGPAIVQGLLAGLPSTLALVVALRGLVVDLRRSVKAHTDFVARVDRKLDELPCQKLAPTVKLEPAK